MAGKNDGKIRCSFCGKTQDQVGRMISGPNGAFICDECVDICAEIIEEENLEEKAPASAKEEINLIKPEEMKALRTVTGVQTCALPISGKKGTFGCGIQSL